MRRLLLSALLYALIVNPISVEAATWSVEQDGSGDFTVIQEAVDAAAAGDVIMIGPGRYTVLSTQNSIPAVAHLPGDRDLTLIGAGADATILSGEGLDGTLSVTGLRCYAPSGHHLEIRDMGFEHFANWAIEANGGRIDVSGCNVAASSSYGFFIRSESGGRIETCSLRPCFVGINVGTSGDAGFAVSNCDIQGARSGMVIADGGQQIVVEDSFIASANRAVFCDIYSQSTIRRCQISVHAETLPTYHVVGVLVSGCAQVELIDNSITHFCAVDSDIHWATAIAVYEPLSQLTGTGNAVSSNICTIQMSDRPLLSFSENDILITDESAMFVRVVSEAGAAAPGTASLANNYWGTTDEGYVSDRIHDAVDDPALDIIVEFLPMAGGSVPTENTGWGDLKATYLGR